MRSASSNGADCGPTVAVSSAGSTCPRRPSTEASSHPTMSSSRRWRIARTSNGRSTTLTCSSTRRSRSWPTSRCHPSRRGARRALDDPGYLPELSLLALQHERLVGSIQLYDNADQVVFIGMIAVHPDARRRGIARLLKVELERRARGGRHPTDRDLQRRRERADPQAQQIARVRLQPALRQAGRAIPRGARPAPEG